MPINVGALGQFPCEEDGSGHSFGKEEIANLTKVMRSGILLASTSGFVGQFEAAIQTRYELAHAIATSSCTSGLQAALSVAGLEDGDEVATTPLTDIGGVSAILQAGLTPLFVDVDPRTGNMDSTSLGESIGPRTRAIIITHLMGNPCEMDAILRIANACDLFVIEDCAQAYDASFDGRTVGTFGHLGVFSTQQTKHISSGEGGFAITDDDSIALAFRTWINKGVEGGVRSRDEDHAMLGMNARMTELQAAVLLPQLERLSAMVSQRIQAAEHLTNRVCDSEEEGIGGPWHDFRSVHTYWKYALSVDPKLVDTRELVTARLQERRALVAPRYLHLPLFSKSLFRRYPCRLVGESSSTYRQLENVDDLNRYPGTREFMASKIVLWWSERVTSAHADEVADLIIATAQSTRFR